MKYKLLLTVIMLGVGTANAQWNFDNSGSRIFDMRKNETSLTTVEIRYVNASQIQAACDEQSRKFGFNGFGAGGAMACSWNWPDKCLMILPEMVDMRTVGHEFMHCLQGSWHK